MTEKLTRTKSVRLRNDHVRVEASERNPRVFGSLGDAREWNAEINACHQGDRVRCFRGTRVAANRVSLRGHEVSSRRKLLQLKRKRCAREQARSESQRKSERKTPRARILLALGPYE